MENLEEFSKKNLTSMFSDCMQLCQLAEIREKFINDIWGDCPQEILERAKTDYHFEVEDIMYEMLNSHSVEKLIDKLKKEFPEDILYICKASDDDNIKRKENKNGVSILVKNVEEGKKLTNDKKFKNILHYFNYFFTEIHIDEDDPRYVFVMLEPHFSNKIKDVFDRNYGTAYHVTTRDNLRTILAHGLRPKGQEDKENGGYRYYPQRIYLILPKKHDRQYVNGKIKQVIDLKKRRDYVVLKVNLYRMIGSFYEDVTMPSKEDYVYTYQEIPPEYIKDITESFNKQLNKK